MPFPIEQGSSGPHQFANLPLNRDVGMKGGRTPHFSWEATKGLAGTDGIPVPGGMDLTMDELGTFSPQGDADHFWNGIKVSDIKSSSPETFSNRAPESQSSRSDISVKPAEPQTYPPSSHDFDSVFDAVVPDDRMTEAEIFAHMDGEAVTTAMDLADDEFATFEPQKSAEDYWARIKRLENEPFAHIIYSGLVPEPKSSRDVQAGGSSERPTYTPSSLDLDLPYGGEAPDDTVTQEQMLAYMDGEPIPSTVPPLPPRKKAPFDWV